MALAFIFATLLSPLVWWATGTHPLAAFKQPPLVWGVTVVALVGYHACIYYATQKAPPAPAALLQGTTPLMIVLGSGERLRWWHVIGAILGLCGVVLLIENTGGTAETGEHAAFYLSLIGISAALWGVYSLVSRRFSDVPSGAMGTFYAAAALMAGFGHIWLEAWVMPSASEWIAVAALGMLPMGLAILFWDFGVKEGDIQALGAFSYVEPFIGGLLVALFTSASLGWNLLWSGCLVVGGAVLASRDLWGKSSGTNLAPRPTVEQELAEASNYIITRIQAILLQGVRSRALAVELEKLARDLDLIIALWDEWHQRPQVPGQGEEQPEARRVAA